MEWHERVYIYLYIILYNINVKISMILYAYLFADFLFTGHSAAQSTRHLGTHRVCRSWQGKLHQRLGSSHFISMSSTVFDVRDTEILCL